MSFLVGLWDGEDVRACNGYYLLPNTLTSPLDPAMKCFVHPVDASLLQRVGRADCAQASRWHEKVSSETAV